MKKYRILTLAVFLLYVTYMAAKNIYTSEIIEIVRHFGVSKSDASLATSFSFIAYALCQLLFIRIIGKINVNRYLLIVSPVSAALFAAVPFCTAIWQVWVIIGLIGAILSGVFPVCMLVIGEYLPDSLIFPANKAMGAAFALSFVLDYFFSSLFIRIADWRLGFYVFPAIYLLTVVFFCVVFAKCPRQERERKEENGSKREHRKKVFIYMFISGMTGLFVNMIYYAVSNWVPSLLNEVFGLSPSLSVFITLLIPLTGAAGCAVCLDLCKRFGFWRAAFALVTVSGVLSVVLTGVYGIAFILTLVLVIILLFIVRGVSHAMGFHVPVEARNVISPASAGTAINIFGCIGAAAGPPLFGALIDGPGGYTAFFAASAAAAVILSAFSFAGLKKLSKV